MPNWFGLMDIYGNFNNISAISWRSVVLVEEIGITRENHRPVASHSVPDKGYGISEKLRGQDWKAKQFKSL